MTEKPPLDVLEKRLVSGIHTLQKTAQTAFDFQADSGPVVHKRINKLTNTLKDMTDASKRVDTNIPIHVIDFIEAGGNPNAYVKDATQVLVDRNQKTHGRIKAIHNLHNALLEEVRKTYPDLYEEYRSTVLSPSDSHA
ncbi:mediator complex, subunit Med10 [Chytriomyces sp. MP71]|nr:mediator complex, subunit Med10 [Chytriomyces sp. MP71]